MDKSNYERLMHDRGLMVRILDSNYDSVMTIGVDTMGENEHEDVARIMIETLRLRESENMKKKAEEQEAEEQRQIAEKKFEEFRLNNDCPVFRLENFVKVIHDKDPMIFRYQLGFDNRRYMMATKDGGATYYMVIQVWSSPEFMGANTWQELACTYVGTLDETLAYLNSNK